MSDYFVSPWQVMKGEPYTADDVAMINDYGALLRMAGGHTYHAEIISDGTQLAVPRLLVLRQAMRTWVEQTPEVGDQDRRIVVKPMDRAVAIQVQLDVLVTPDHLGDMYQFTRLPDIKKEG